MTDNMIILHDVQGISRKSGVDQHNCTWTEFEVDYLAEQEDGECSICHERLSNGWMCMEQAGKEVCTDHVVYEEDVVVCTECHRIVPELDIYYTGADGKDYCQHCYDFDKHGVYTETE